MRRFLTVCGLVALGVGAVVACGDTRPNAAIGSDAPPSTQCATPQEGCACTVGSEVPCAVKVTGNDDFVWCAEGTRSCATGSWGSCETSGSMSVKSVAKPGGGIHVQALGTSIACTAYDGGATLDPCDPYCQVTNDTPLNFDAGPSFIYRDGGLVARGCGDGLLAASEECDDGNSNNGDGCSKLCQLELGYMCPTPGSPCVATTCGNNVIEGAEECDDGNNLPYDNCSPTCQLEVRCPIDAPCDNVCGDGLLFPGEACDDGNTRNGDGCDSACAVEPGATCNTVTSALPPSIDVPVIYRDFKPDSAPPVCTGDWQRDYPVCPIVYGLQTGLVEPMLNAMDRKPRLSATRPANVIQSNATFNEWYNNGPNAITIYKTLNLLKQPDDSYMFTSNNFYPLNGEGWGDWLLTGKNYHFTSELRYPFTLHGGEKLTFKGDDDVFVFINGHLAVDLGGVHASETGVVTLGPTSFGMTVNNTYEIAVFQAERKTAGSNYQLNLAGFERTKSVCEVPQQLTVIRDFEGVCQPGHHVTWQLFRWRAFVPPTNSIEFRAATSDDPTTLPATPDPAPVSVDIGNATNANSPNTGTPTWQNKFVAGVPIPVSKSLKDEANQLSKKHLRVFMSFKPVGSDSPRLDEWQQLYDCIPDE